MGDNVVYDQMEVNASTDAWDDEELIKMYDRATAMAHEKVQRKDKSKWKIGDTCMALYADDGKCYPAKIISIDSAKKKYEVLYTEYDEKAVVLADDLFRLPSSSLNITANSVSPYYHTADGGGNVTAVLGESWRGGNSMSSMSWKRDNKIDHSFNLTHSTMPDMAWCRTSNIQKVDDGRLREETWKNIYADGVESRRTDVKKYEDWRAIGKLERQSNHRIADSFEPTFKRAKIGQGECYKKRYLRNNDYTSAKVCKLVEVRISEKRNTRSDSQIDNELTGEPVNSRRATTVSTVSPTSSSSSYPPKYSASVIQRLAHLSQNAVRQYNANNQLRPVSLREVFDLQAESLLQQMAGSCANSLLRATRMKREGSDLQFDSVTYNETREKRRICRAVTITAARLYEFEKTKDDTLTLKMYDDGVSALKLYFETIHEKLGQLRCSGFDSKSDDVFLSEDEVEWTDEDGAAESGPSVSVTANGNQETFPIPDLCPPPPPSLFGKVAKAGNNKEALTNMLMSWYMSGYHTGFYQGMQQASASAKR